ncbi:hypothetical protein VTJ49DRAFT_6541 [Mycothermus thermophilus]|uniref:Uncharacterized protein n=1 Tax=Humicola insolens TaxID=85995 RepID=A0ABR3V160_HUMIN
MGRNLNFSREAYPNTVIAPSLMGIFPFVQPYKTNTMRIGSRSTMARVALFGALLAQLQPVVADVFYTVTSYFVYSLSTKV